MKTNKPKVKVAFPLAGNEVRRIPDALNIHELISREKIHLYNPFRTGTSITTQSPNGLTYQKIMDHFVVDSEHRRDTGNRSKEMAEQFDSLKEGMESFWPAAKSIFIRLCSMPKRDLDRHNNITPEMGLVVTPPKRQIKGPSMNRNPGPPKAGGR
jgi:hypothetical protein